MEIFLVRFQMNIFSLSDNKAAPNDDELLPALPARLTPDGF